MYAIAEAQIDTIKQVLPLAPASAGLMGARPPFAKRGDRDLNPHLGTVDQDRELRAASVLIGVVARPAIPTIIFTKRAEHLRVHAGQVSFPGGSRDPEDDDAVVTALREAEEEIALPRASVDVVGTLGAYVTGTGFEITPVVGIVPPGLHWQLDRNEVDEVFEVPLAYVLNPRNHERHTGIWRGETRHYYAIRHKGHYIWGATAGMLVALADVLKDHL
ncbi:MAG: CoA pyrophosphatase [Pseudomonadota bacterium]